MPKKDNDYKYLNAVTLIQFLLDQDTEQLAFCVSQNHSSNLGSGDTEQS